MSNIIKLIYINILSMFNINKIIIAREDGVKSNLEIKSIITCIIFLFLGYLYYGLLTKISFNDITLIFSISYTLCFIICLIINLTDIGPLIFKNNDNDMLFSLPITLKQILFSKLFSVYIKNLIPVLIIMTSTILAYTSLGNYISDMFAFIYIFSSLVIPFIPIVISSFIIYFNELLKNNLNKKIYNIIKYILALSIIFIIYFIFSNNTKESLEKIITNLNNINLLSYLFTYSLKHLNILCFISEIAISFLLMYLFYEIISNNYLRITSRLKGIKKKEKFIYKKTKNYKGILGVTKKELLYLFQNKTYLLNSIGPLIALTFTLFITLNIIDFNNFKDIKFFDLYLNTFSPAILALMATASTPAISSMSLEKDNFKMLLSMPISLNKIIIGKFISSILISSIFIIINGIIVITNLHLPKIASLFCFILPLFASLFITSTSLFIDTIFIEKNEKNDNIIIKQRIVNLVPMCLSILIGFLPLLTPITEQYYNTLGSYIAAMIVIIILEIIYYCIKKQSIIKKILQ